MISFKIIELFGDKPYFWGKNQSRAFLSHRGDGFAKSDSCHSQAIIYGSVYIAKHKQIKGYLKKFNLNTKNIKNDIL